MNATPQIRGEHRLCSCGHASYEVCSRCAQCGADITGVPLAPGDAVDVNSRRATSDQPVKP